MLTTHSEVPIDWISDPATVRRGWWRDFEAGAITLARVRLHEPAHVTLGIPLTTAGVAAGLDFNPSAPRGPGGALGGLRGYLMAPFEFWLPEAMLVASSHAPLAVRDVVVVQVGRPSSWSLEVPAGLRGW